MEGRSDGAVDFGGDTTTWTCTGSNCTGTTPPSPLPIDPNQTWISSQAQAAPSLEGYDQLASTLTYIDAATVAGGISTFNKVFSYQSGVDCANC